MLSILCTFLALGSPPQSQPQAASPKEIEAYLKPYVDSGNFAGVVLMRKGHDTLFEKAYGDADRESSRPNTPQTRFHIASVSMQFTAAGIMRLIDSGAFGLDSLVSDVVPNWPRQDKITIRHLLLQRSGLPDLNELPGYEDLLKEHQTPAGLVAKVQGLPGLFEPGSKFLHEEHSAYNLLAMIIEQKTGLPFAAAMEKLVFGPAQLKDSGIDDDAEVSGADFASGTRPDGTWELAPAPKIHWSGKSGNGSTFASAQDLATWIETLTKSDFLTKSSKDALFDEAVRNGYGWFKGLSKRYGETAYYMNGRSPGFTSFVLYLPKSDLSVVIVSNIYSSATTTMGYDLTSLALGQPVTPFAPAPKGPAGEFKSYEGTYAFGPDFYQPNATLKLSADKQGLSLRWPSGDQTFLIPLGGHRFLDRSYWVEVTVDNDTAGKTTSIHYGKFEGPRR